MAETKQRYIVELTSSVKKIITPESETREVKEAKAIVKLENGREILEIIPINTVAEEPKGLKVTVLHIELKVQALEVEDLEGIRLALQELQSAITGEAVIISGRLPIWAYMAIAHMIGHIVPALGSLDAKEKVGVIVISHARKIPVPTIVKLPEDLTQKLIQVRS